MGWCKYCNSEQEVMRSKHQCRECNNLRQRTHARKRTKEQRQAERRKMYEKQGRRYQTLDEKRAWIRFKRDTRAIIKRLRAVYKPKRVSKWAGKTPAEVFRIRYRTEPEFNLYHRMRMQERRSKRRHHQVADLLRGAIKRDGNSPKAQGIVGYDIKELKEHLEKQFTKRMNWEKFMTGEIHIDHIIPLADFDLTKDEEVKAAWQLSNLRPLWAKENRKKAAKREGRLL